MFCNLKKCLRLFNSEFKMFKQEVFSQSEIKSCTDGHNASHSNDTGNFSLHLVSQMPLLPF